MHRLKLSRIAAKRCSGGARAEGERSAALWLSLSSICTIAQVYQAVVYCKWEFGLLTLLIAELLIKWSSMAGKEVNSSTILDRAIWATRLC